MNNQVKFPNQKRDERQDESPAHEALREALINSLVHALYGGSTRIVILKLPAAITMSNPGFMLVSLNQYYDGGISECRNPSLQKMFGLIGRSDKAGSIRESELSRNCLPTDCWKWSFPRHPPLPNNVIDVNID